MQKLFLAGANPNARVSDHSKHQEISSGLEIVKKQFGGSFSG
jgi:hypothetical protein